MSLQTAQSAARKLSVDGLDAARQSPSSFARPHNIDLASAIETIFHEIARRRSHRFWRK